MTLVLPIFPEIRPFFLIRETGGVDLLNNQ